MNSTSPAWWRAFLPWVVLLVVCGTAVYGCFVPRFSAEDFSRQLEAAIPRGTPRADVEAWLNEREIYHYRVKDERGRESAISGKIFDTGPRVYPSGEQLHFKFYFDEDDRLSVVLLTRVFVNRR